MPKEGLGATLPTAQYIDRGTGHVSGQNTQQQRTRNRPHPHWYLYGPPPHRAVQHAAVPACYDFSAFRYFSLSSYMYIMTSISASVISRMFLVWWGRRGSVGCDGLVGVLGMVGVYSREWLGGGMLGMLGMVGWWDGTQ